MDVILKQDVEKLGKAGSRIKAKDGFARNYLIPHGLAIPATASNIKELELERQKKLAQSEKLKKEAQGLKEKLDALSLTIAVLTHEEEKLYANIGSGDIAAALKEEGFTLEKSTITLEGPIKALGIYEVPVKLHPEVTAKLKLWIVKK